MSVDQFGVWVKPHHLFSIYILYIVNIYDEGACFAIPPLHPLTHEIRVGGVRGKLKNIYIYIFIGRLAKRSFWLLTPASEASPPAPRPTNHHPLHPPRIYYIMITLLYNKKNGGGGEVVFIYIYVYLYIYIL